MSNFHFGPSKIAEWYSLVCEAQHETGYYFDDSIQHYLVMTLDHFTTERGLVSTIVAIDFLEGMAISKTADTHLLRRVGDHCLIISGLFPERALRKNVSLNYFIGMGQQAYDALAIAPARYAFDAELFKNLSTHFVGLMDVLHTMRQL